METELLTLSVRFFEPVELNRDLLSGDFELAD
jgi:hypothetical protein